MFVYLSVINCLRLSAFLTVALSKSTGSSSSYTELALVLPTCLSLSTHSGFRVSKVRERAWDMYTPRLRWTPEHSIHSTTPMLTLFGKRECAVTEWEHYLTWPILVSSLHSQHTLRYQTQSISLSIQTLSSWAVVVYCTCANSNLQ